MTLLHDIQNLASGSNTDLVSLLLKTKILAHRLKQDELRVWADHEVNGYPSDDLVPNYRVTAAEAYGHFYGSFGAGVQNQRIPMHLMPEIIQEHSNDLRITQGVGSLIRIIGGSDNTSSHINWPINWVNYVQRNVKVYEYHDYVLVEAWWDVPAGFIKTILDTVRSRVLDFSLELEREELAPEDGDDFASFSPGDIQRVAGIVNVTIFQGGTPNVQVGNQQPTQTNTQIVMPGDFTSLRQALSELGVNSDAIDELEHTVAQAAPQSRAEHVWRWFGKVLTDTSSQAAAGGVLLLAEHAPQITHVLQQFLGH